MRVNRNTAAALTGAAVVLVGGGTALAGQAGDENRSARCEERVAKLAEERGVSIAELEAGIKARLSARIDAALASGRVTPERAARLKERIAAGTLCQGAHVRVKRGANALLRRAADFLGLTKAELRAELPGTSLGALALERGKSVESLEAALLAPAKARLAKAVESRTHHQGAGGSAARAARKAHRPARRASIFGRITPRPVTTAGTTGPHTRVRRLL